MTTPPPAPRLLVAGIGNIFRGDDGFGVEVVRALIARPLPPGVRVADYGIRGVHLAYDMLRSGYDTAVLIDAMARGNPPGTLYLLEPDEMDEFDPEPPDAHNLTLAAVLAWLRRIGGQPPRVLIVGCEPATIDEAIGLSAAVAAAVSEAVDLVIELTNGAAKPAEA